MAFDSHEKKKQQQQKITTKTALWQLNATTRQQIVKCHHIRPISLCGGVCVCVRLVCVVWLSTTFLHISLEYQHEIQHYPSTLLDWIMVLQLLVYHQQQHQIVFDPVIFAWNNIKMHATMFSTNERTNDQPNISASNE